MLSSTSVKPLPREVSEIWFFYFRKRGGGKKISIVSIVAHDSQSILHSSGYNDLTLPGPDRKRS